MARQKTWPKEWKIAPARGPPEWEWGFDQQSLTDSVEPIPDFEFINESVGNDCAHSGCAMAFICPVHARMAKSVNLVTHLPAMKGDLPYTTKFVLRDRSAWLEYHQFPKAKAVGFPIL